MPTRDDTELSRALRAARGSSKLTQVDVVTRTKHSPTPLSQARLSRIEAGKALPTEQEVRDLARIYDTGPRETTEMLRLAHEARAGIRDSRLVVQRGNTLAMQQRWRALERDASTVRSYQPVVVLGALQTAEYAAVAMQRPVESEEVQERVRRQARFTEPGRALLLLQTETSLRQLVGSADMMKEQIDEIIRASETPGVELGVIPADRPMPVLVGSAFHIYDDSTVVVGLQVAAATLTDPDDVDHFRDLFDQLSDIAVWGDEARERLSSVRLAYETNR